MAAEADTEIFRIREACHIRNFRNCILRFPEQLGRFSEALEVDDLPFPQELDHVVHVRVVRQPQDVVIGYPCFLPCYKSNMQPVTVFPVTVMVRRARAASSKFCSGRASASADASLLWGAKAPGHRSGAA